MRMTGSTVKKAKIRKNWVAPELKKIDIEAITAHNATTPTFDGGGPDYYS
jgi:hypothetical protein